MNRGNRNVPIGLIREEQEYFINNWNKQLKIRLEDPTGYGMSNLAGINIVMESDSDLDSFGEVKMISDTRLISKELLSSSKDPIKDIYLTECASIATVLKCLAFGLDFGNSSNNVLELDSIASYIPNKNIIILDTFNSAYDLQSITNERIIELIDNNFKLSDKNPKNIIRADYVSLLQGDSPRTGKFLVGDFNPDNVTLHYSVKKLIIPRTDDSYMFSIVLAASLTVNKPEDIYVVQVPFLHRHK